MTDAQLVDWIIAATNRNALRFQAAHKDSRFDIPLGGGVGWSNQGPGFSIARDDLVRLAEADIHLRVTSRLLK